MSSKPESYNWNAYIQKGELGIKAPPQDEGLPTLDVASITYDDAPREMLYTKLLTEFQKDISELPAKNQAEILKEITKARKGSLTWGFLQAIQLHMVNVLFSLANQGYISEANLSPDLREKFLEIREGKTPSNTPSKGVWNAPKPRPGG